MGVTTVGTIELVAKIDTGAYKKGANEIDASNKKIEGSTDKADSGLTKLAKNGLKTAVVGFVGLATAIGAMTIGGGISRALNIEDAQAKLRGLGHDAKSVEDIMTSALDSVKGTAYGLDAAATLAATAVAAGVKPGQELTKYLSLAADAATIAGTSLDEMGSIFGKVQTQQRAYTQELNMLADRGIPIYQWLQDELGKTQEELRDMVAKGELDSETYFKAIQKNIGGAALESGKTTRGAYQNLLAAMSRIGARIVQGPIDKVRTGFGDLTKWIDRNADTIVNAVQGAMRIVGDVFNNTIVIIRNLGPLIIAATAAWVGYTVVVKAVEVATKLLTIAQLALNAAQAGNKVGLLIAALSGLVTIFTLINANTDRSKSAQERLTAAQDDGKRAADALRTSENALKDARLAVEGSALAVERAQRNYNEAVAQYGPNSLEAREAAYSLTRAQDDLAVANKNAADRTKENEQAQKDLAKAKDDIVKAQNDIKNSVNGTADGYKNFTEQMKAAREEASKGQNAKSLNTQLSIPGQKGLPMFPGQRAAGGPVKAGMPYFVGENPDGSLNSTSELFVPNSSGRIVNSRDLQDMLGSSGSNIEYNIANINISSEVDGERWLRRLTNDSEIVSHGLVPQQRYMGA